MTTEGGSVGQKVDCAGSTFKKSLHELDVLMIVGIAGISYGPWRKHGFWVLKSVLHFFEPHF